MKFLFIPLITFLPLTSKVLEETDASPEYLQKTYQKALVYYKKGKYEESLNHIRHVIKSDMGNYSLRMLAGHNYWKKKIKKTAIIHFMVAINSKPDLPNAYIDLALLYLENNSLTYAFKIASKGLKSSFSGKGKLHIILSKIALKQGSFIKALDQITKAKAIASKTGKEIYEALITESRIHLVQKNYDRAEIAIQWANSLNDNDPYTKNLLGFISEIKYHNDKNKKNYEKAEKAYKEALNFPNLNENLKNRIKQNLSRLENG